MNIKKIFQYTVLAIIVFFVFKPLIITGYCSAYTPHTKEDSDTYFMSCLYYDSYLNQKGEYFLNLLDKIEDKNKGTKIKDYLYNTNMDKGNVEKANGYLNKWKKIDYKNGTFEYFGIQEENDIYSLEKKNLLYQEELKEYKKYSTNKDISSIVQRYKNWLSMHEKEKFYEEGLLFANNLK